MDFSNRLCSTNCPRMAPCRERDVGKKMPRRPGTGNASARQHMFGIYAKYWRVCLGDITSSERTWSCFVPHSTGPTGSFLRRGSSHSAFHNVRRYIRTQRSPQTQAPRKAKRKRKDGDTRTRPTPTLRDAALTPVYPQEPSFPRWLCKISQPRPAVQASPFPRCPLACPPSPRTPSATP